MVTLAISSSLWDPHTMFHLHNDELEIASSPETSTDTKPNLEYHKHPYCLESGN